MCLHVANGNVLKSELPETRWNNEDEYKAAYPLTEADLQPNGVYLTWDDDIVMVTEEGLRLRIRKGANTFTNYLFASARYRPVSLSLAVTLPAPEETVKEPAPQGKVNEWQKADGDVTQEIVPQAQVVG